jgi:hypothetical protein
LTIGAGTVDIHRAPDSAGGGAAQTPAATISAAGAKLLVPGGNAMMQKLYVWNSAVGPFYIVQSGDGRFHVT